MKCRFAIIALLFAALPSFASQDTDRAAIRAHIERIFQAYIDRDCATIRSTHSDDWIGFTTQARSIVHGIDGYMKFAPRDCQAGAKPNPDAPRMTAYKILAIDYELHGDIALVPYIAQTTGTVWKDATLRSIDVYKKQKNGGWIQIGSNIYIAQDEQ